MKVAYAEDNVRGSQGLKETASFKINASAQAFQILSSGLYSDKVRAVLREIGCNAQDAHIAAGCRERPIRVKIPNALDNQFYIQDWGPGLSHEEVMGLYSTYFASTKQSSNDFTGAFGLGSKSPFSYTDSFSVVSVHGGRKRTYTIYLSNEGAPTTSLMSEEDPEADWPQGVRVGFSVKPKDYTEFESKAQEVFQWFATTPEMRGCQPVVPVTYRVVTPKYSILDAGDDACYVLMGSVAYPLDLAQLGVVADDSMDDTGEKKASYLLNWTRNVRGLVLPVNIGDVRVAASRETLQYDQESVKFLKARAREVVTSIGREIIDLLEVAEKGGWADICAAGEKVQDLLKGAMSWQFTGLGRALGLGKARCEQLDSYIRRHDIDVPGSQVKKSALKLVGKSAKGNVRIWTVNGGFLHDGSKAKLKIDPETAIAHGLDSNGALRAKRAIAEGKYNQVLVVTRSKTARPTAKDILADAGALSAALGDMPMVALSTMPPPDTVKGGARKKKPKGWVPTLDAAYEATVIDFSGKGAIKKLGDIAPAMACLAPGRGWGRSQGHIRIFDTTAEDDRSIDLRTWDAIWGNYAVLAGGLALPDTVTEYAQLSAAEIKGNHLKQLGWPNMHALIDAYLQRKDVRDGLRAKLKSWKPTLPEYMYHHHGWISQLAACVHDTKKSALPLRKALGTCPDVLKIVEEIVAETQRTKKRGTMPPEIVAYQHLATHFPSVVKEVFVAKDCLSLEDLDQMFVNRFPRSAVISGRDFIQFYERDLASATELLEFILSKEV